MKFEGSCHCRKIHVECEFDLNRPILCNCSYCAMRNSIVHVADTLSIKAGLDDLTFYTFNKMKGKHAFCSHCGIFIYLIPPKPIFPYAVNLFILENCDWKNLDLSYFDGKSL